MLETMKLLKNTKSKMMKNKNGDNMPLLEINEVVLALCNIANNDYQRDLWVLHKFVPNKLLGQLLDKNFIFLETFNSDFSCVEVWFTDQNSKSLEVEDKINITSVFH